jgi:hypothetical protein
LTRLQKTNHNIEHLNQAFSFAGEGNSEVVEKNIMFLESHICCVSSGTVSALYCWEPQEVRGANPTMKK